MGTIVEQETYGQAKMQYVDLILVLIKLHKYILELIRGGMELGNQYHP